MRLEKCDVCPHNCKVNRNKEEKGKCKGTKNIKIALSSLHFFEEPCISSKNGSGTIFFSHCNLNCIYCQNYEISANGFGIEISNEKLAEIFIKQQKNGANNINLVSPTIYALQIKESIILAKKNGLNIPIIYNSSRIRKSGNIKRIRRIN